MYLLRESVCDRGLGVGHLSSFSLSDPNGNIHFKAPAFGAWHVHVTHMNCQVSSRLLRYYFEPREMHR